MGTEPGVDAIAEAAGAEAVDDADLVETGHERAVEEVFELIDGLFDALADEVDFAGGTAGDAWLGDLDDGCGGG